jgi:hypothetical protein
VRQRVTPGRALTDGDRRLDAGAGRRPQWRRLVIAFIVGLVIRLVLRVLRVLRLGQVAF